MGSYSMTVLSPYYYQIRIVYCSGKYCTVMYYNEGQVGLPYIIIDSLKHWGVKLLVTKHTCTNTKITINIFN